MAKRISEHFTLEEMYSSYSAKKRGIDNTPSADIQRNLVKLVTTVLEPIREKWDAPILVSSGYRCPKLNAAVGGSKTSQHLYGQAADIKTKSDSVEDNKKLFNLISNMIKNKEITVGQLIDEYNYNWIHVSTPANHTNQILHIK